MILEGFIARYGVLAILLGAGLEGEAVVVTGGVLAQRGLIPLLPACVAAAAGSCLVDQTWFHIGRRFRDHPRLRAITRRRAYARAMAILERRPTAFILAFRFIYGLRTVSPVAIGTSRVSAKRFLMLNALAAAIWGPSLTLLGYLLGRSAFPVLTRVARGGLMAMLGAVVVAIVGLAIWSLLRRHARTR